jgi:hypothetical protein
MSDAQSRRPLQYGAARDGWTVLDAKKSCMDRYEVLTNRTDMKILHIVEASNKESIQKDDFVTQCNALGHGEHIAVITSKPDHGFSWHIIRELDLFHVILFNRAMRVDGQPIPAVALTVPGNESIAKVSLHYDITAHEDTSLPGRLGYCFYHDERKNKTLSQQFTNSKQSSENCATANTNISWHFAIAARLMRENPEKTFVDAYRESTKEYKALRTQDRAQAFTTFLSPQIRQFYYNDDDYNQDLLFLMRKFFTKASNPEKINPIIPTFELMKKQGVCNDFCTKISSDFFRNTPDSNATPKKYNIAKKTVLRSWGVSACD